MFIIDLDAAHETISERHLSRDTPGAPSSPLWCAVPQSRNKVNPDTHDYTKQGRKWACFIWAVLFTVSIRIIFFLIQWSVTLKSDI